MKRLISFSTVLLLGLFLLASCKSKDSNQGAAGSSADAIVTVKSDNDFFTTVSKFQSAVAENNLVLLKEYNIQAMMKMVEKQTGSFTTYQVFHPRYGKTLIENDPRAFANTPLGIIIRERGNTVEVQYRKPSDVYRVYDLPSSFTNELDQLFSNIVSSATQ